MESPLFGAPSRCVRTVVACVLLGLMTQAHGGEVTYIYTDPQNSPLAEANAAGQIIRTFDYKPYGGQAMSTASSGPGYTGHVHDPDTDLVYMQARYYDPDIGAFLSTDPSQSKPGDLFHFGEYLYASDNPLRYIDPDGRLDYEAMIRDRKVPIHIDDKLPQSEQNDLKSKIDAGIAKINNNDKLTSSDIATIGNVKSISVAGEARRSNIEESTGAFTLTKAYVNNGSATWLASAIGHDGKHVDLFREGGIGNSRGLAAEQKAMGYQRELGMRLGMSSREVGYLEMLIADPQALKAYIQTNP